MPKSERVHTYAEVTAVELFRTRDGTLSAPQPWDARYRVGRHVERANVQVAVGARAQRGSEAACLSMGRGCYVGLQTLFST